MHVVLDLGCHCGMGHDFDGPSVTEHVFSSQLCTVGKGVAIQQPSLAIFGSTRVLEGALEPHPGTSLARLVSITLQGESAHHVAPCRLSHLHLPKLALVARSLDLGPRVRDASWIGLHAC